jgi:hypothetical protein
VRLPQECSFCGESLADPDVPEGVDRRLFSLVLEIRQEGVVAWVCPFCRKVLSLR